MRKPITRHTLEALAALGLVAVYFAVSIPVAMTHTLFLHHWLAWNVFLALLPAVFAWLFLHSERAAVRLILAGLWLLFFPNAPYLATDMMHVRYLSFGSPSLYPWLTLMQMAMALFLATILGLWSLKVMHQAVRKRFGKAAGWGAALVSCFACGYGVYLGRFLRLNSWDVLDPLGLLRRMFHSTDGFALRFTAVFGCYVFCTYLIFLVFSVLKTVKTERESL